MNDPDRYSVISGPGEAETKVKGSRFLAFAWPATVAEEGEVKLEELRKKYHDATHVCFAWKIGHGAEIATRAADAGEPGGTAGIPIFGAIEQAGLSDCAVAVVRWYGGTKLGTGGLKRAYAESARLALASAPTATRVLRRAVRIVFAYAHTTLIRRLAARHRAVEDESDYGEEVSITFLVPRSRADEFRADLVDTTAGRIRIETDS